MPSSVKTTSLIATSFYLLLCLFPGSSWAQATISPDITRLLTITAEQNDGVNLDIVAQMAIAANPAGKNKILQLVSDLKQKTNPVPVTKLATIAPAPKEKSEEIALKNYGYFEDWNGEVELNILSSSGNSRQSSFGLGGSLEKKTVRFHHVATSFFDFNRNTGVTDKQKWGLAYKLDYNLTKKVYITSLAGYENDKFGPFRERVTTTLGLGYPIISNNTYSWKVEAGPSLLFTKEYSGDPYDNSMNAFANSLFKWTINERSKFTNNTIFYIGSRKITESKTALKVKINGALSSKFSFDIFYNQTAPLDRKKIDTVTRAGLSYDF